MSLPTDELHRVFLETTGGRQSDVLQEMLAVRAHLIQQLDEINQQIDTEEQLILQRADEIGAGAGSPITGLKRAWSSVLDHVRSVGPQYAHLPAGGTDLTQTVARTLPWMKDLLILEDQENPLPLFRDRRWKQGSTSSTTPRRIKDEKSPKTPSTEGGGSY